MAGLHQANSSDDSASPQEIARNSTIGWRLFLIYSLVYGLYVAVNAFAPSWMEKVIFWGLNLAILSGFGLILFAVLMAFVYGYLCRKPVE